MTEARYIFLNKTKVGGDYRTTIPQEVRKILGLTKGDEMIWIKEGGKVLVDKVKRV